MQIPIERFTLDNGMRVVLSEDHAVPLVAVNIWYNVGSRNEEPGRTGLAHLFEHMMFQGSQHVAETGHIAHVERVGGSVNGTTWLDRTNYYETVPSSELEMALWLESDRMGWYLPALTQEKLDNQRSVVKNERRQRVDNQPYGDWDERLQKLLFPAGHPYHHPVIGSMDDLDAAGLDDVADFFRTYYAPNNAVLSLVGDFDPAEARALVEKWFGPIPRGPAIPPIPGQPSVPPRLGGEIREEVTADVPLPRVYLGYRTARYGQPEFYVAEVCAELLAGGKSARLYDSLVRERRLAQTVGAFAFPTITGAGALIVRVNAAPGVTAEEIEAGTLKSIEALRDAPPGAEEMATALTGIVARQVMSLQKLSDRADQISMSTMHFDDPELVNGELDRYRAVTAEDVHRFAVEALTAENRAVLTYVPASAAAEAA
ncbi:MAG TPA: pitrilysin family protein [Longimicrobiaceae bacterium]|nr:pitrilysin family protein [Longimicrobiaceae bacterium]